MMKNMKETQEEAINQQAASEDITHLHMCYILGQVMTVSWLSLGGQVVINGLQLARLSGGLQSQ